MMNFESESCLSIALHLDLAEITVIDSQLDMRGHKSLTNWHIAKDEKTIERGKSNAS